MIRGRKTIKDLFVALYGRGNMSAILYCIYLYDISSAYVMNTPYLLLSTWDFLES